MGKTTLAVTALAIATLGMPIQACNRCSRRHMGHNYVCHNCIGHNYSTGVLSVLTAHSDRVDTAIDRLTHGGWLEGQQPSLEHLEDAADFQFTG